MSEVIDVLTSEDITRLAVEVFNQGVIDYVHLIHPSKRTKTYLFESYLEAIDLFWDPHYRLDFFLNEDNDPMDLEEFLKLAADRERVDIESLYGYLAQAITVHWSDLFMDTIHIPHVLTICEVPYYVYQSDTTWFKIDYEKRIIHMRKQASNESGIALLGAVLEIICFHRDLKISIQNRKVMAEALYMVMKLNNNFKAVETKNRPSFELTDEHDKSSLQDE